MNYAQPLISTARLSRRETPYRVTTRMRKPFPNPLFPKHPSCSTTRWQTHGESTAIVHGACARLETRKRSSICRSPIVFLSVRLASPSPAAQSHTLLPENTDREYRVQEQPTFTSLHLTPFPTYFLPLSAYARSMHTPFTETLLNCIL